MADILAATQPCADDAAVAGPAGIASLRGLDEPPPARASGRFGHGIALAAAALLHAGLLYALIQAPNDLAGGGGTTLDAIAVTLVSSDILDSRSQKDSAKSAASTATVKAQVGSAGNPVAPAAPPSAPSAPARPEAAPNTRQQILASSAPASEKAPRPAAKPKTKPLPESETHQAARPAARPLSASPGDTSAGDTSAAGTSAGGVSARARTAAATQDAGAPTASPGAVRAYAGALRKALDGNPPSIIFGPDETGGTVRLQFALSPDGALRYVHVLHSSGIAHLDLAAVHAIKSADLPRPPEGMTPAELTYKMPYKFVR